MKLEVVVVPVSDVDRAKNFYALGWREDADYAAGADFRRAAAAHGKHEEQIGHPDPDWPDWCAQYMVQEQAGRPGLARPGAST